VAGLELGEGRWWVCMATAESHGPVDTRVLSEKRSRCFAAKQNYYAACQEGSSFSESERCCSLRSELERDCPAVWVQHFDRTATQSAKLNQKIQSTSNAYALDVAETAQLLTKKTFTYIQLYRILKVVLSLLRKSSRYLLWSFGYASLDDDCLPLSAHL
jgi:hypothetical protein